MEVTAPSGSYYLLPDTRPDSGGSHADFFAADGVVRASVATIICVYNEEWHSLNRTLQSLGAAPHPNGNFDVTISDEAIPMDIAVVIDGVVMLQPCMRKYLEELFGKIPTLNLDKEGKSGSWDYVKENGKVIPAETCIVNKRTKSGKLFSLVVKRQNQKKINSHEWGLRAFAHVNHCKYILTTDCGTLFDPECVQNLFKYMEANESCVACTGRQRIMTAEQQVDPNHQGRIDTVEESVLRRIQRYELEFEHLASRPAGSITGYLELLPGPCAFFRRADIEGTPLDEYFSMGYKPPKDLGLLQSNLKISEDRITSWSSVWAGKHAQYSALVDNALFYSEAEMTARDLTLQRRRWLNGKFSGQVFVLSRLDVLFSSENPTWMKISCTVVALLQVAAFLVSYLSVANFGGAFHQSAKYLCHQMDLDPLLPNYVTSIYFTLYVLIVLYHVKRWDTDEKFSYTLWIAAFLTDGCLVCLSLLSMAIYSVQRARDIVTCFSGTHYISRNTKVHALNETTIDVNNCLLFQDLATYSKPIALACMALLPFVTSLLSDLRSFCIILNPLNMLTSMLALPTYTAFFSAYSISRYADLTWGQRPTVEASCEIADHVPKCSLCSQPRSQGHKEYCDDHRWLHKWVNRCRWAAYVLMVVNVGATISFCYYLSPLTLLAVVYVNGSFQQTLALMRMLALRMKKFYRICSNFIPKVTRKGGNASTFLDMVGKPERGTPVPVSFRPEVYIIGQKGMSLYEISRHCTDNTSMGV